MLGLAIAVGSKTVGKVLGRQESAAQLARVMEKRRKVWDRNDVAGQRELVLLVSVDERTVPQYWICFVVRSCDAGCRLGAAKRLGARVRFHFKRAATAQRVSHNLDTLGEA